MIELLLALNDPSNTTTKDPSLSWWPVLIVVAIVIVLALANNRK